MIHYKEKLKAGLQLYSRACFNSYQRGIDWDRIYSLGVCLCSVGAVDKPSFQLICTLAEMAEELACAAAAIWGMATCQNTLLSFLVKLDSLQLSAAHSDKRLRVKIVSFHGLWSFSLSFVHNTYNKMSSIKSLTFRCRSLKKESIRHTGYVATVPYTLWNACKFTIHSLASWNVSEDHAKLKYFKWLDCGIHQSRYRIIGGDKLTAFVNMPDLA